MTDLEYKQTKADFERLIVVMRASADRARERQRLLRYAEQLSKEADETHAILFKAFLRLRDLLTPEYAKRKETMPDG